MRSSNLIFIAGLIFILLTDTIFWIQLKQYLNKKWQILLYGLHTLFFICTLILFQYSVSRLKGPDSYFWIEKHIGLFFLFLIKLNLAVRLLWKLFLKDLTAILQVRLHMSKPPLLKFFRQPKDLPLSSFRLLQVRPARAGSH